MAYRFCFYCRSLSEIIGDNEFVCGHPFDQQQLFEFVVELTDKLIREIIEKKKITKTDKEIRLLAFQTAMDLVVKLMSEEVATW